MKTRTYVKLFYREPDRGALCTSQNTGKIKVKVKYSPCCYGDDVATRHVHTVVFCDLTEQPEITSYKMLQLYLRPLQES